MDRRSAIAENLSNTRFKRCCLDAAFFSTSLIAGRVFLCLHSALVSDDEEIYRVLFFDISRWRTLLSVDDLVEDVVSTLDAQKLLEDTYIIFSSDNGFHLGKG